MDSATVFTAASTVVASLGGVIAFLYRQLTENAKLIQTKLDDCESDREDLWKFLLTKFPHDEVERSRRTKQNQ